MACSKRQCSYVFLGFGLLFLLIGIICGLLLPKVIVKMIEQKSCVDSMDDPDYEDWAKPNEGRVSKLYYWVITNKEEFLYHGKIPKLKEKGPYTYDITSSKIDVSFANKRRTFRDWSMKGVFSKEKSCSSCLEDDNITILNLGYIGAMANFGGDSNFAFLHLPYTLNLLLKDLNYSYTQLGNVEASAWQDTRASGWSNPEFGVWLNATTNFTEIEMRGLYGALTSMPTLFGVSNVTIKEECSKNPTAQYCGLLAHLVSINKVPASAFLVNDHIANALCTNTTSSCFNTTTQANVVPLILPYILHVGKYTMWDLLHEQDDLVITTSQKNLALGYTTKKIRNPVTNEPVRLPGFLRVYEKEEDAKANTLLKSFYTCDAEKEKIHQWASYNGQQYIPSDFFNLSEHDRTVNGYSMLLPHSKNTNKACSFSRSLPMDSFQVFVSEVYIKFTLTYQKDVSMYGLNLKRYTVTKNDFLSHSGVHQGLVDQTKFRKMPFVFSLPHFLYVENTSIPESFYQKPSEELHKSTFDADPVTGAVVRAYLKAQVNAPIPDNFVSVGRIKPLNISYVYNSDNESLLEYGIPVFWAENGGEAKEEDIETIKTKIVGLLGLSCGLLIAFPVIGGIFIIVFVALLAVSIKANQVREIQK